MSPGNISIIENNLKFVVHSVYSAFVKFGINSIKQ
jgi:hypothetical protein